MRSDLISHLQNKDFLHIDPSTHKDSNHGYCNTVVSLLALTTIPSTLFTVVQYKYANLFQGFHCVLQCGPVVIADTDVSTCLTAPPLPAHTHAYCAPSSSPQPMLCYRSAAAAFIFLSHLANNLPVCLLESL